MADLIDADELNDELGPPDWLERPRGHACPECHAHIGYSSHHDADKQLHTDWHHDLDRFFGKVMAVFDAMNINSTTVAFAPEPKEQPR